MEMDLSPNERWHEVHSGLPIDSAAEEDKSVVHKAWNLINILKPCFDIFTFPCKTICVACGVKADNIHTSHI